MGVDDVLDLDKTVDISTHIIVEGEDEILSLSPIMTRSIGVEKTSLLEMQDSSTMRYK